jgi:ABC-type transport system involved in multi-copper enzyme maturation permease subunit
MKTPAVRIRKEARLLLWPWCAVVAGALVSLILPEGHAEHLSALTFFVGLPLLATLSLGSEFQQRTLSLWLAQPASRSALLAEKMIVGVPAVLSAALVSGLVLFSFPWWPAHDRPYYALAAAAYVVVATASAPLWTLAARSTVGGLLLVGSVPFLMAPFLGARPDMPHGGGAIGWLLAPRSGLPTLAALGACLSGLTLWLGAERLRRFEVTGGAFDDDLLVRGPAFLPSSLAAWLRCRRSDPLLNMVRRDLGLLRPVWQISALTTLYTAGLSLLGALPVPPVPFPRTLEEWVVMVPIYLSWVGLAGLAGILPLGEERSSGTHASQLTLPVSIQRQWLVKLVAALATCVVCSLLLPTLALLAGGALRGSPFLFVHKTSLLDNLVAFPILTLACFWCACATAGTVRAAVWVFPASTAVFLAGSAGRWAGGEVVRGSSTVGDFVISSFHWSPFALAGPVEAARTGVLWLFVPALLLGLAQSYELFRQVPQEGLSWTLRRLVPLVGVTLLWSGVVSAGFAASSWEPFGEVRRALGGSALSSGGEVSGDELARDTALSSLTQRWLRGARISVAPDPARPSGYRATIRLAGGLPCTLTAGRSGAASASCGN